MVLRRFYGCAEDVLFPDAVIDKLIGDQVMALYLPNLKRDISLSELPIVTLKHARGLLGAVGYGSGDEPFVEMGVGSTSAKPSWATSAGARSTTSQPSAMSSTRHHASRWKRAAERSCSLTVWRMACRLLSAHASSSRSGARLSHRPPTA